MLTCDCGYSSLSEFTWFELPDEEDAVPALADAWPELDRRYLIVVHGAMMVSSWSCPTMFAPLRRNTPTTLNETFLIRSSFPMGDSVPNSSRLIVSPITQTFV